MYHANATAQNDVLKAMRLAVKNLCWIDQKLYVTDNCNRVHVAKMFPELYQECLQEAAIALNRMELERKRLLTSEQWGPGLSQENADYPILPKLLRMGFCFKCA
jgi:hypothetical protein